MYAICTRRNIVFNNIFTWYDISSVKAVIDYFGAEC